MYWELPTFALAGSLATPLFWDEFTPFTWPNHILIASKLSASCSCLMLGWSTRSFTQLLPWIPISGMGQSLESCVIPKLRLAALPFPSTFLHEHSASRLISCDISLKQPSLGELARTQELWAWRGPFPPHLQTAERMEQWEKPHPLGYTKQLPLLRGKAAKGKSEGEACTHQKGISSAKSRLFKNPTDSHSSR